MTKKSFLTQLQEANEDTKNLWIIAGTSVVMLVIVFVWLTWFNNLNTLAGVPGGSGTANIGGVAPDNGFSLWQSVKAGISELGGIFQTSREYIIKPQE